MQISTAERWGKQKVKGCDNYEKGQEYTNMKYLKYKEVCPKLNSLELTLKWQEVCREDILRNLVMEKVRSPDFELKQLEEWAVGLLKEFGIKKDIEQLALEGLDPRLLS